MSFRSSRPSRALSAVACAALLVSTGMIDGAPVAAAPAAPSRSALLAELRGMAGAAARVSMSGIDGTATFVGGTRVRPLAGPDGGKPTDIARAFVDHYASVYGVEDPAGDLVQDRTEPSLDGGTTVRFRQEHDGVRVLAGEVAVQLASNGSVLSTSGEAVPHLDVDTTPTIDGATASVTAMTVTVRDAGLPADALTASEPELIIYDPSLLGTPGPLGARLVWHVDVRTAIGDIDQFVLVDAHTGAVALHINQREDAKSRSVCDNANVSRSSFAAATCPGVTAVARAEGQGPVGNADVNAAYDLSGATYDFYFNQFGRDSVDGAGLPLKSTVRFCIDGSNCPYVNAFWNGFQMVYGQGYASADDVVGHELTHGVTDFTSQLFYYAESGAINESMSDVMGELMDLQNGSDPPGDRWKLGEDIPGGAIRNMADPTLFQDPDRMGSLYYDNSLVDNGGVHVNSGVNNKAAFLMTDGGSFNGQSITGIGAVKTGAIYYQAETTLLGPGSDYLDLYNALQQACANLIGTKGIVAADCTSVQQAVTATEMNLAAATGGTRVTAPRCGDGQVVTSTQLTDGFETGLSQWSTSFVGAGAVFSAFVGSSQGGTTSLHGEDPDGAAISEAHTLVGATIPAGAPTYLRFDHSFSFDYTDYNNPANDQFWDGGLVFVSTTGPDGTYTDIASLGSGAAINGYAHNLQGGGANPYRGRAAFAGVSQGYQSTRYDLSSLAGKTVYFMFQIGSDATVGTDGWFIDDLAVYSCGQPVTTPTSFVPVGPERVFDTRPNESAGALVTVPKAQVLPGADLAVQVANLGGGAITPAAGVGAVSLNVAVTNPAAAGFVTVYPCANRKVVASVNFVGGQTVSNAVIAPVSPSGTVCFYSLVPTDLIVDINGWFPAGSFTAVGPERVFDTRPNESAGALVTVPKAQVLPGADLAVQVSNLGGGAITPAAGVGAVSLNVAVTNPAAAGFVTVYPCANRKVVASVNFVRGQTVSNAVIAPVSPSGTICFYSLVPTDIIVDINGWFPAGASFTAVGPERVFDTRPNESAGALVTVPKAQVLPGADLAVTVVNLPGGITPANVGAVSLNVAVTNPAAAGFVTVYPCANRKLVASVNFVAGQTVSNAVIAPVSPSGTICFYSLVPTDIIVDINGWFPANAT